MPVVDASVVTEWVSPVAHVGGAAIRLLHRLREAGEELIAPRLLLQEVANSLVTGVRVRRWSGEAADLAYSDLRSLPIRLIDEVRDMDRAWELSRRYDNHPVYDMVYVAVAERGRTQLFTADQALLRRLTNLPWVRGLEG